MPESSSAAPPRGVEVPALPGPDFTLYRDTDFAADLPPGNPADADSQYTRPCHLPIRITGGAEEKTSGGRALACLAYRGRFWSVTFRCDADNARGEPDCEYRDFVKAGVGRFVPAEPKKDIEVKSFLGYYPRGCPDYRDVLRRAAETGTAAPRKADGRPEQIFLNDVHTLCSGLGELLFGPGDEAAHPSGLVVVTGATDSSKSIITRGLIFLFMQRAAERARRLRQRKPHLLTFEDPIEKYYVKDPETDDLPKTREQLEGLLDALYVDYTPREKGLDAAGLRQVTKDALRQTPAVLFVGETREEGDWKALLEFAASGHLVVTTSHSGSVVEAMRAVFKATDTENAAQRSELARRVRGIVNIRSFTPAGTSVRALLPALWRSTDRSMNNLVADGLSSMLPSRGETETEKKNGCFGRTYFAARLTADTALTADFKRAGFAPKVVADIKQAAFRWDIKGE